MNQKVERKIHWSFWLVSIFMLVWNLMGCLNFIMQMNPDMVSSYRETEQAIIQGRPLWATLGFALSVFGGAIGCIFLLLKSTTSFYLFIASLLGTLVAVAHSLNLGISFSSSELVGIVAMPILVSVFLVWYSKFSQNKEWLSI